MKKILGAATASVMALGVLAGCGGGSNNSSGSYCDDIKSTSSQLKGLDSTSDLTADKFNALQTAVHKIAGEAPGDVKGSWASIEGQFTFLQDALDDAGLSIDDFGEMSQGHLPDGVDPSDLAALQKKLSSYDTSGLQSASTKIEDQVKSDCDITLDLTS
jgi:hypothetical protein